MSLTLDLQVRLPPVAKFQTLGTKKANLWAQKREERAFLWQAVSVADCAQPKRLYASLETLWPERFGTWYQFHERYCLKTTKTLTLRSGERTIVTYEGLNPLTADEWYARLRAVSTYTLGDLLPKPQQLDTRPAWEQWT